MPTEPMPQDCATRMSTCSSYQGYAANIKRRLEVYRGCTILLGRNLSMFAMQLTRINARYHIQILARGALCITISKAQQLGLGVARAGRLPLIG